MKCSITALKLAVVVPVGVLVVFANRARARQANSGRGNFKKKAAQAGDLMPEIKLEQP